MGKVLITGGAGFIGSHLAEELAQRGTYPVIFDNLKTGKKENLDAVDHTFIEGDVRDIDRLSKAAIGCDSIFHLAALTSVVQSMREPDDYFDVNLNGTLNVLNVSKNSAVTKVVFSSSAAVYGDSPVLPKTEDMKPEPKSPYAITKISSEYLCDIYRENYGLLTVCARFFNVFGERQDPASPYAAAMPIFISKTLRNEPIPVYGDGSQTRDFVYVKDVAKALICLLENENAEGVYNIGYGKPMEINWLVRAIQKATNANPGITYVGERPGEIKHSFASVERLRGLGFQSEYFFEQGLERSIQWFAGQKQGSS
jgi:UDP-glucose 4-epimerase